MEHKCSVGGCGNAGKLGKNGKRYLTKGLCAKHYARLLIYGSPEYVTKFERRKAIIIGDVAKIPLGVNAKDGYALVDREFAYLADECNWTLHPHGYAYARGIGGKMKYIHRIVVPEVPSGMVRDHINRDKLDNRAANIRVITQKNNTLNRGSDKRALSIYKGVSRTKPGGRWRAYISQNGRYKHLGHFDDELAAAGAYNKAAALLHGDYAYLNKISQEG